MPQGLENIQSLAPDPSPVESIAPTPAVKATEFPLVQKVEMVDQPITTYTGDPTGDRATRERALTYDDIKQWEEFGKTPGKTLFIKEDGRNQWVDNDVVERLRAADRAQRTASRPSATSIA